MLKFLIDRQISSLDFDGIIILPISIDISEPMFTICGVDDLVTEGFDGKLAVLHLMKDVSHFHSEPDLGFHVQALCKSHLQQPILVMSRCH